MAKYALPLAFAAAGGALGGSLGASIGLSLGTAFFGPKPKAAQAQIENLRLPSVDLGGYVSDFYGSVRTAGTWMDCHPNGGIRVVKGSQKQKMGTGGGRSTTSATYNYFLTGAYALGEGLLRVDKIWADTKPIYDRNGANAGARGYSLSVEQSGVQVIAELSDGLRLYRGSRRQMPDSVLANLHGGHVSAYRGTAYIVFNNLDLSKFGNRIPTFTALVTRVDATGNAITDAAQIVTLHAAKAGVPRDNLNLTQLVGKTIPGAFQTSVAGARSLMEQVARWHYCGLVEVGGIITDFSRKAPKVWRLSWEELGAVEWENGAPKQQGTPFARERAAAREIPTHVVLKRPDPALDFDYGVVEDIWQTAPCQDGTGTGFNKTETVEVQIVADDTEAAPRVGIWKDEMLAARIRGTVTLDIERIAISPGDVIEVPTDASETNFVSLLIEEQTLSTSGLISCTGAGWDGEIYTRSRALPTNTRPKPGVDVYTAPVVALLDTATLDEDNIESPVLILAATTATGTKRSGTRFDLSIGGKSVSASVDDRAVMGFLRGDYQPGNPGVVDYSREVVVEMIFGNLISADQDDVASGRANLLAIGNRLIRFAEAIEDPASPGVYTLTGICDAENATDWTGAVPDGSKCVLLVDESKGIAPGLAQVPLKRSQIGAAITGKAVSLADDKKFTVVGATFAGNSLKALSPVSVMFDRQRDAGGAVTGVSLAFQARTRYPEDCDDTWNSAIEPRQSDRTFGDGLTFRVELRDGAGTTKITRRVTGTGPMMSATFTATELGAAGLDPLALDGRITSQSDIGDGFSRAFSHL